MLRKTFVALVRFYQKYISPLKTQSCRYYPTCSEYAKWSLSNDKLFCALPKISLRILRCNPLFIGGIDYPVIKKEFAKTSFVHRKQSFTGKLRYWFIPYKKGYFFVIKTF